MDSTNYYGEGFLIKTEFQFVFRYDLIVIN